MAGPDARVRRYCLRLGFRPLEVYFISTLNSIMHSDCHFRFHDEQAC